MAQGVCLTSDEDNECCGMRQSIQHRWGIEQGSDA